MDLRARSTAEVLDDHLRLADAGNDFEADLERNVSPGIVVFDRRGIFRGHDGVRELARALIEELGDGTYEYTTKLVEGRFAFLEWTGDGPSGRVRDGADSFVIEDGWIVAQTIHYTVET
jgi:hypothetical protein